MPTLLAERHGLSAEEAHDLAQKILKYSRAESARINIESGRRTFARCADNRITTAGGSNDVSVSIVSVFGKRVASVRTNILDDESLLDAVGRSESLARLAPENPEYLSELGPQEYTNVEAYYESTGDIDPAELAEAMSRSIKGAGDAGFVASGYIDVRAGSQAVATSNGLFAYQASTGVASTLTVRTPDGSSSGWAGDESADWRLIETDRIVEDAVRKCETWRGHSPLDAGTYTVVLEPTAAGMLMLRMAGAFDARSADEGRSFFSDPTGGSRVGEKVFEESITIVSDPTHSAGESEPFAGDGAPRGREVWIENGVVKNLGYSRFWANKQGVEPRPDPANLIVAGGADAALSLEDLIRSTERGVLITRFWYIRGLNPRTIAYTGLTRDGTFLIEDGKISRPVNNFRFNQSLAEMLVNVEQLGTPVQVAAGENSSVGTPVVVPAMKIQEFNLASISDAI
jgi:predicted Zn-dependent protease